ncbi:MAG: bifunctional hydroxymethylpyrimidine kinase/phosphomethylpyrimidine kinase [Nitrospiraceae bacterium]|nr:bifunctional hydroxymethylpyrimidine kinase/phosphomethylpyrimidine kinase [Nitrospiraceae bacterium]
MVKTALTVAGSDPSGGAGLQADLKVFKAFGVHGLSIPAALTAQNTAKVGPVLGVERAFLEEQFETLLADIKPDAMKTGMLLTRDAIRVTAEMVKKYAPGKNFVIDPVSVSSSGRELLEKGGMDLMRDILFPLASVITPNIYEASVLTGMGIETPGEMEAACRKLKEMGPAAVIITGGHLEDEAVDIFHDGRVTIRLEGRKLPGSFHGTGCVFSAAITAGLALGRTPEQAARQAKEFITEAVKNAFYPGSGMGILI